MMSIMLAPQWCRAADERTARQFRHDVLHAVVRFAGGGRVIKRQQSAGENLNHEEKHRHAADDLVPAGGGGNVFVEEVLDGAFDAGAMFEPVDNRANWAHDDLGVRLRRSDVEPAAFDLGHEPIQRARGRAAQDLAVDGKDGVVAGTHEGVARVVPMVGDSRGGCIGE